MFAWVVLRRNRHIGARERRQLIPHVRFSGSISGGGKSIEIRLRMCRPPLQSDKRITELPSQLSVHPLERGTMLCKSHCERRSGRIGS